jgi:hypothetical protein
VFDTGDRVHITNIEKFYGELPYFAGYIVVAVIDEITVVWAEQGERTYEMKTASLTLAKPNGPDYRIPMRYTGMLNRMQNPAGYAARFKAYQESNRRMTPTEIEKNKQAGLGPLYAKMDADLRRRIGR